MPEVLPPPGAVGWNFIVPEPDCLSPLVLYVTAEVVFGASKYDIEVGTLRPTKVVPVARIFRPSFLVVNMSVASLYKK
jgi:hypothetical protein